MASKISELVVSLGLNTASFNQKISEVNRTMKLFESEFKNSGAGIKNFEKSLEGLNSKLKLSNQQTEAAKTKIKLYKEEINKTKETLAKNNQALDESRKKLATLKSEYEKSCATLGKNAEATKKLKDEVKQAEAELAKNEKTVLTNSNRLKNLETNLNKTEADMKKFTAQAKMTQEQMNKLHFEKMSESLEKTSKKFKSTGEHLTKMGKTMSVASAGIIGIGVGAVKAAENFEQGMAEVQAISGASANDLQKLSDKAKEMGVTTKFSAVESAEALKYMAMAGWKTGQMIDGLPGVMNLAAASGENLGVVSDIVTDALTAFGLQAKESAHFSDVLATAANSSNTSVAMLGESFKYAAPVAGALKYSIEDTTVALGLMANSGIKATSAGTALRTGLTNLAKPTKQMKAAMEKYGISLKGSDGNMRSLSEVMELLRDKLGGLSEDTKAATVAQIFGKEAMSGWLAIINASDSDFVSLTNSINNSTGAAQKMADIMNNTTQGQLTLLKSQLKGLAISIGDKLLPHVNNVIKKLSDLMTWFGNLSSSTQNTIIAIAGVTAAIGPLLIVFGKMATGMGSLIGLFGKAAKSCAGMSTVFSAGASATATTTGAVTKLVGAFVSLNPVVLGVTAAIAAFAAGAAIYTTNNEVMSQTVLKTTDDMSAFERILDKLNGGFSKSKEELQSMGLVYKDFSSNVSEEFKNKVQQSTDKLNEFTLEISKVNFDNVLSKDDAGNLQKKVEEMCNSAIATIKDKKEEANKSMKQMFLDDGVLSQTEKEILDFLSKTSNEQITKVNELKAQINAIWQKAVEEKRGLNDQEIKDVQDKMDKIAQIELESLGKNQEEILYAKNDFIARTQSIDLEGASKLMEEKAKIRDEETAKIEASYNTNIDILKSKLEEANGEEKRKIEEAIKNAESSRDKKVAIERETYDNYLNILAEKNPAILSQINEFNGQILTKQDLKKQKILKTQQEEFDGMNRITESGYYQLKNKTTGAMENVIVTVDKSSGKITGVMSMTSGKVGGYTNDICKDLERQGKEYGATARDASSALAQINGATVNSAGQVRSANGQVIGSLRDVKREGDNTKSGIIDLNGTPVRIKVDKDGAVSALQEVDGKIKNIPTFKQITISVIQKGKEVINKIGGIFSGSKASNTSYSYTPDVSNFMPKMSFGARAVKANKMSTGFSIDVPKDLQNVNSGYNAVGSTFVKQITTTARNSANRQDSNMFVTGNNSNVTESSETNKLLKQLVNTMLNGGIVVQSPVYLNGRQIAVATSPYMNREIETLKHRQQRLGGKF